MPVSPNPNTIAVSMSSLSLCVFVHFRPIQLYRQQSAHVIEESTCAASAIISSARARSSLVGRAQERRRFGYRRLGWLLNDKAQKATRGDMDRKE
jgi:hypothetical protein